MESPNYSLTLSMLLLYAPAMKNSFGFVVLMLMGGALAGWGGMRLAAATPAPTSTSTSTPTSTPAAAQQWKLVWGDEFDGADGAPPDPAKWVVEADSPTSNNEQESYTARTANLQQRGGRLVITALKEDYAGANGVVRHYTSARINTKGKFSQAYGRVEASIELPLGKGIWPAFWMLGDDIGTVGWPKCGEIDMMENIGDPRMVYSTLHGPGYSGAHGIQSKYMLPSGQAVNTGFHRYAVEWAPGDIKFYVDDVLIGEKTPADLPVGTKWVYDHPFFIILNLAVGGAWPGMPDATTAFPQRMLVDYVRVYQR